MSDSVVEMLRLEGGPEDGKEVFATRSDDRYFPSLAWVDLLHHYHRVGDALVYQGVVDRATD